MASDEQGQSRSDAPSSQKDGAAAVIYPPSQPPSSGGVAGIWAKIKRHKVVEWTLAYVAFAYAFLHGAEMLSDAQEWPRVVVRVLSLVLILGVPFITTLAWYHGQRAQHRISGPEFAILTLLLVLTGSMLWWLSRSHEREVAARVAPAVTTAITPSEKSVAVLPFLDLSEKHDQEYFADGMAEEVIDLLAKIPALKVIGRTSSFQFKGRSEDLRTIGTKLNVAYVLEGSVRRSTDRVRVTVQLVDTRDGVHRWSETYDRDFGDVLKIQDDIAAGLVRTLEITLGADLPGRPTLGSPEAYNLYLRGRYAYERFDREGLADAVHYFQQALALDPTSAVTHAWLSRTFGTQGDFGDVPPAIAYEQSRQAAERALKLDPKLAYAHALLGTIHVDYDWDWAAAGREYKLAAFLAPGDSVIAYLAARLPQVVGRWDDALTQLNAAAALDPSNPRTHMFLSMIQLRQGSLSEAETEAKKALEISPTQHLGHWFLGLVQLARGEREVALVTMQQETVAGGQAAGLAIVCHALGRKAESDAALARMIQEQGHAHAFQIAEAFAYRGERDQALQWLERAYTQKDPMLFMIKGEFPLRSLESDPRYKTFLRKMNLPE